MTPEATHVALYLSGGALTGYGLVTLGRPWQQTGSVLIIVSGGVMAICALAGVFG